MDLVAGILREAARWLAGLGVEQWPSDGFPVETVAARIERKETYVAEIDSEPVATLSLDQADPEMWGPEGDDRQALYIHRMAVCRAWAGRQVGDRLLDWAAWQARIAGRPLVRLDCVTANEQLVAYYLTRGWRLVRTIVDEIGVESLFEKPA